MKRSLSANPTSYGFREQASYILLYIKYQCIILWSCCFVVLLFSDFVECISNAINKTTRQQNNQTTLTYFSLLIFYSYLLIFYSYLLIFYFYLLIFYFYLLIFYKKQSNHYLLR